MAKGRVEVNEELHKEGVKRGELRIEGSRGITRHSVVLGKQVQTGMQVNNKGSRAAAPLHFL